MVTGAIFVEQNILAEFSKIQSVTHLDASKQMSLFIQLYNCIKSFEDYIRLPEKSPEKSVINDFFSKLFTVISCGLESNSVLEGRKSDPGNSHVEDTSGVKTEINSTALSSSFESETRAGVCNSSDAELLLTQTVASSEDTDNSLENTEMKKTLSTIHSAILVSSSEHTDNTDDVVKKGCKREKRDTSGVRRSGRHTRLPVKLSSQEFVGLEDAGLKSGKHTSNKAVKLSSVTADEKSFKTTSKDNSTNSADDDAAHLAEDSGSPEQKGSEITERKTEYKSSKQFSVKRGRKAGLKSLKSIRQFSEKPTKKKFNITEEKESVREQAEQMSSVANKHCTSIKIEKFQTENEEYVKREGSMFRCKQCDYAVSLEKYLSIKIHIRRKHEIFLKNPLCSYCKKHFADGPQLQNHIKSVHRSSSYLCDTCGKSFTTKQSLRRHRIKWHDEVGHFQCYVCFYKTYDQVHLEKHMKIHTKLLENSSSFLCHLCGRGFKHNPALQKHLEQCLKKIVCNVCAVSFTSLQIYKQHVKGKHGEKQYRCKFCDKTFRWRSSLLDHNNLRCYVQNNKPVRPHKCLKCDKRFKWFSSLRSHSVHACPCSNTSSDK